MQDCKEIDDALRLLNELYLSTGGGDTDKRVFDIGVLRKSPLELFKAARRKLFKDYPKKWDGDNTGAIITDDSLECTGRMAVYSCMVGSYDDIKEPIFRFPDTDYYMVTDGSVPCNSAWTKIDINGITATKGLDNIRKARYVKTHPHILFPDYEYSIWVDANIRIVGDLRKYIRYLGSTIPFASNWHPSRNCIFDERKACSFASKGNTREMKSQVADYKEKGMPRHYGLIETNVIVRRHSDERVISLMEDWFDEIQRHSTRDQLSLPFVLWRAGYKLSDVGFICSQIRENPDFIVTGHSKR